MSGASIHHPACRLVPRKFGKFGKFDSLLVALLVAISAVARGSRRVSRLVEPPLDPADDECALSRVAVDTLSGREADSNRPRR